jgi:hypothetical protein
MLSMMTLLQQSDELQLPCTVRAVKDQGTACTLSIGYSTLTIHFSSPDCLIDWCRRAIVGAEKLIEAACVADPIPLPPQEEIGDSWKAEYGDPVG